MSATPEPTAQAVSSAWWIPTPQNRSERIAVLTAFGMQPHRFRTSTARDCKECGRARSFVAHDEDLQPTGSRVPRRRGESDDHLEDQLARANAALHRIVDSENGAGAWARALSTAPDRAAAIVARVASVAAKLEAEATRLASEVYAPIATLEQHAQTDGPAAA
jgi:hypothetical protein